MFLDVPNKLNMYDVENFVLLLPSIRGAQVTINLEDDFHNPDMDSHSQKRSVPVFVRSHQVSLNVDSGYILILQIYIILEYLDSHSAG